MSRACVVCDEPIVGRHPLATECVRCLRAGVVARVSGRAHSAVFLAVIRGHLRPARALACVDCGLPARDYDHRRYSAPLVVDPTCRACNLRRGPAVDLYDLARAELARAA